MFFIFAIVWCIVVIDEHFVVTSCYARSTLLFLSSEQLLKFLLFFFVFCNFYHNKFEENRNRSALFFELWSIHLLLAYAFLLSRMRIQWSAIIKCASEIFPQKNVKSEVESNPSFYFFFPFFFSSVVLLLLCCFLFFVYLLFLLRSLAGDAGFFTSLSWFLFAIFQTNLFFSFSLLFLWLSL